MKQMNCQQFDNMLQAVWIWSSAKCAKLVLKYRAINCSIIMHYTHYPENQYLIAKAVPIQPRTSRSKFAVTYNVDRAFGSGKGPFSVTLGILLIRGWRVTLGVFWMRHRSALFVAGVGPEWDFKQDASSRSVAEIIQSFGRGNNACERLLRSMNSVQWKQYPVTYY